MHYSDSIAVISAPSCYSCSRQAASGAHAALSCFLIASESLEGARDMKRRGVSCVLMWYNVENLFHPSDDSLPGDDEFTPKVCAPGPTIDTGRNLQAWPG